MNPLQEVIRSNFRDYAASHKIPIHHHKAAWSLQHCRTATLGGHVQACPDGHVERIWYNSCKHRSCPQCNQIQIERWLDQQKARLLGCAHHHIIFTLPHELNVLWQHNRTEFMQVVFQAVRDTLMTLCGDNTWLGAVPGFVCALHTWGRSLSLHPHIHCLITDGGLGPEGQWKTPKKSCFLPTRVVRDVFKGKCLAYLRRQLVCNQLTIPARMSSQQWHNLFNKLGRKKWNVRIQERYPYGDGVIKYLARYVKGGPLKIKQIVGNKPNQVRFRYYSYVEQKTTHLNVSPSEFLRRYLEHVPEKGKQVVRHYGLYAHRKTDLLNQARQQHGQNPVEKEVKPLDWQSYLIRIGRRDAVTCPVCGQVMVAVSQLLPPHRGPPVKPESTRIDDNEK